MLLHLRKEVKGVNEDSPYMVGSFFFPLIL